MHTEGFYKLYSSPSIIRITVLRSMRWVGHVAHIGEENIQDSGTKTWRDILEHLNVDRRMLTWILNMIELWIGFIWLTIWASRRSCEHGNEPSASVTCWEQLFASQEGQCSLELVCWLLLQDARIHHSLFYNYISWKLRRQGSWYT
jgi:hypothetical protein